MDLKGVGSMKLLSIGIEDFKELIDKDAYYVDKTKFIANCINEKCILYTRPRRFGKTLNMSMLYYFFSNKEKENAYLFDNLAISKNKEAMKHQNKYPTLFITLKELKDNSFESNRNNFSLLIFELLEKNKEILHSDKISNEYKKILNSLYKRKSNEEELKFSLKIITQALYEHYQQKVILLIDEYDVPLQSAYQNGYYDEMVDFIRSILSSALKTNSALEKGVLTGCLRISKESIFTGLNNFTINSLLDYSGSDDFGFTPSDIDNLLKYYELTNYKDEIKEWYDGYLFGDQDIYNPWSTLVYIKYKKENIKYQPTSYWANTSGNDIIMNYIQMASPKLREEFEQLLQGKSLIKEIKQDLTYKEMDNINNVYSFLLLTGYLKIKSRIEAVDEYNPNNTITKYELVIPNKEVSEIYRQKFMDYFNDFVNLKKNDLYQAMIQGQEKKVNDLLDDILERSISYYDNYEAFYHGFLVGLFNDFTVESNQEAGKGRFDVCIFPKRIRDTLVLIECKHSSNEENLIEDSKEGIKQIINKKYLINPRIKKYENNVCYSISFYKKQCYVTKLKSKNHSIR